MAEEAGEDNSPTAEEVVATREAKAAMVASKAAMIRTSSRVVANGRRRSNPSYEFSLTSLETPKSRTVQQT